MKSDVYGKILVVPPLLVTYIPILVFLVMRVFCRRRFDQISLWVATNAFSNIFKEKKKKTCCTREARWLFKEIDLTAEDELLSKVLTRFLMLFSLMFGAVLTAFWLLFVLDVSYDCDEDDLSKDCFERKWTSEPQDPLNCSSAAVQTLIQNGTIQVVCKKIVLNFGLASGASYGTFKLIMFAIKVCASALSGIETTRMLRCAQGFGVFLVLGINISLIVVETAIPSVAILLRDKNVAIVQVLTTTITAFYFIFLIPWRELIETREKNKREKNKRENP